MTLTLRFRSIVWFTTGAMLATAITLMFLSAWSVDAAPGDDDSTFVGITPCRLADTRPAPNRVGPAATLGEAATETFEVVGTHGECTIPGDAVAISLNVTALGATVQSFLTFWPDGPRPLAASLNPAPGQPPVPNAVTVDLSDSGSFDVYNNAGTVDAVIDVNGYYTRSSLTEISDRLTALEADGLAFDAELDSLESTVTNLNDRQPVIESSELNSTALVPLTTNWQVVTEVEVTAPSNGSVAVFASGFMQDQTANQFIRCRIDDVAGQTPDPGTMVSWDGVGTAANLSVNRVFDIGSGEVETYSLLCQTDLGGGALVGSPQLTAIFTFSNTRFSPQS